MNKVEKAILRTIAAFDILNRPLTLEEIWHFLYREPASKLQVLMALEKLEEKQLIVKRPDSEGRNDYYVFCDRKNLIANFGANQELISKRFQKVSWVVRFIQLAPFIKNISIINSLAFGTSKEDSDIDILLITKRNRLWIARAVTVLLLEIIGQNKNKWHQAGKFCLGWAFDETRFDLGPLRLKKDIHLTYWLASLSPIYDRGAYRRFIESNSWLTNELPNWHPKEIKSVPARLGLLEKLLSGRLADRLEKFLAKLQIDKIWREKVNRRQGASVIAESSMMKLHAFDKRHAYQQMWEDTLLKLGIKRP